MGEWFWAGAGLAIGMLGFAVVVMAAMGVGWLLLLLGVVISEKVRR